MERALGSPRIAGASLTIGSQDGTRSARFQAAYNQLSGAGFDASISD
jgi:hypothetical protein